jgi:hypothetical protein
MKESSLNQEGTLSIRANSKEKILLNPERFKVRMIRVLSAMNESWAEFRRLQRYGRERCRERE